MPAKRAPAQRRAGAAKAVASLPVPAAEGAEAQAAPVAAEAAEQLGFIPADPEDPRLTLAGLVLDGEGKVDLHAYEDLMKSYVGEPSPDKHPDPEHPGVRSGERVPKGLRVWDDVRAGATSKDGAGWVAVRSASKTEKKKEKWFNIRMCGSWRMAFILARLQKAHWDERAAWLSAPIGSAGVETTVVEDVRPSGAATSSEEKTPETDAGATATPKRKKTAPSAALGDSQKRPRRMLQQEITQAKGKASSDNVIETAKQMAKEPLKQSVVDALSGNPRLLAIVAAAQERQKAQQAAAASSSAKS